MNIQDSSAIYHYPVDVAGKKTVRVTTVGDSEYAVFVLEGACARSNCIGNTTFSNRDRTVTFQAKVDWDYYIVVVQKGNRNDTFNIKFSCG